MATFGQLYDMLMMWARNQDNLEAETALEEWIDGVPADEWERVRMSELGEELFFTLARDVADYYRELITGTCTDKLYILRVASGHEFLQEMWRLGVQLGLQTEANQVDVPLTATDLVMAVQRGSA